MRRSSLWLWAGAGLTAAGLLLLGLPSRFEGPVLLPLSPGHGLSLLDVIGLAPLLSGIAWLYYGLWQRRCRLYEALRAFPARGGCVIFTAGLGTGLLLASALSAFYWWWAIGAVLLALAMVLVLWVATQGGSE